MNDIENLLFSAGVKNTPNRVLVARALKNADVPVSLADLETILDTMDRASIFRVLTLFVKVDLVHAFEDGSGSLKYELCACRSHDSHHHSLADMHPHFHCEKCGRTFCLDSLSIPELPLPQGFIPTSANFTFKGLCPACSSKPSRS